MNSSIFLKCVAAMLPTNITLNFHSISNVSSYLYASPQAHFNRCIELLASLRYTFVKASTFAEKLQQPVTNHRYASITFDDGYRDNFDYVLPYLEQKQIPFSVFASTGFCNNSLNSFINSDQVKSIARSKIAEIQSHTVHHFDLQSIDVRDIHYEFQASKDWIESLIGYPVASLAYPFGSYNSDILKIASEYFSSAFAVHPNHEIYGIHDICRVDINRNVAATNLSFAKALLKARKWQFRSL